MALRLGSLYREQAGAEVVQFALVIPIVVGVVLVIFNLFQIVSLRARMRTTASQMAQYITAYAVPPEDPDNPAPDLCDGLQQILDGSFVGAEANTGEAVLPTVSLYVINDPLDASFVGNRTQVSCQTLAERLQVNQQFAVELAISVNWLWINAPSALTLGTELMTLTMNEYAFGVCPGEPFFHLRNARAVLLSEGPGGCNVRVQWEPEGSFMPQRIEIYEDNDSPQNLRATISDNLSSVNSWTGTMSAGEQSAFLIRAICDLRQDTVVTPPVGCDMPAPTPAP